MTELHPPVGSDLARDLPGVVIHRSHRRKKTIQAHIDSGTLHVFVPHGHSPTQERKWVDEMRAAIDRKQVRKRAESEIDLEKRAKTLNKRYFGGMLEWSSIEFTQPGKTRYGWCRPDTGDIRISAEVAGHPRWVLDYVIVHEMAHLVVSDHSKDFWELVRCYPRTERARGYLDGFARAGGRKPGRGRRPREAGEGQLSLLG